ncbi:MAG: DNA mismatch repair endonuclease MutL [Clostridia bacterium]|nr:DNA mismatch repair endonuclease MutL [Clostridia bacterium]
MGKINVLSFEIANLIAAGEVVERPASVLKELIENSIDAGATNIVAEIKRGGVAMIRVSDNGCGISKEDLPVALKRHATSKISSKEDLSGIMTLGFRGEALAAISSVCEMTIITKTAESDTAYMLTAEAGNVVDLSEVYAQDGTTVVVSNLFYNVPARRKFLKKDATEAMNVAALVERVALSRPDISIQLLIDGEEKFRTPGDGKLGNTIYSIYGKAFASKMIEVFGDANGIKVSGYIGRSDNVKKNRNLMNVFINGRYVKSLTAQAAIEKAYTSYIATECFPTCVLFLEINPSLVDVNVHPAKLEVKFSDERSVFETVYYTVKSALEEHEYRPELELGAKKPVQNLMGAYVPIGQDTKGEQISISAHREIERPSYDTYPTGRTQYSDRPSAPRYIRDNGREATPVKISSGTSPARADSERIGVTSMTPKDSMELLRRYKSAEPIDESEFVVETLTPPETEPEVFYKYVGEAFDCFVMIEYEGALLIIDKHAAHERVIFEELKERRAADGRVASQMLMLPLTVLLSPEELASASEYREEITSIGFEYTVDKASADITAIPDAISAEDAEALFIKMLDELAEGRGDPKSTEAIRREKALYQVACKAAIKGGRVYDRAVIDWLIQKILRLPDITVCPHGRPIAYKLTKTELERQFERIK